MHKRIPFPTHDSYIILQGYLKKKNLHSRKVGSNKFDLCELEHA